MQAEPCKVCGSKDLNLIDGFYYCVECGTQDVNVRETLLEERTLADGTFGIRVKTKVTKIVREKTTMSPEWHKWHAYNYILAGLADEVVALGAGPSFKTRVLWLWTLYVKKFQKKKELGLSQENDEEEEIEDVSGVNQIKRCMRKVIRRAYNVAEPSNHLFFTILYLALNFDKNDIQLTQLIRFVQEGRLSHATCSKFLPKDIDVDMIDGFKHFYKYRNPTIQYIRICAMTFLKTFNLGPPVVPDLIKIVDRYVKELCLPNDFKHLVYSLMQFVPCDHLDLARSAMKHLIRIPFYEGVAMSYVLVALKMCFGLDDEYEVKLSDAVDKINEKNSYMKSYKLGAFSTSSDRLFSFREWCNFLQLRKMVLCKYYWPMAEVRFIDADDYVYAEQRNIPWTTKKKPSLSDDIIMNILNKIQAVHNVEVIPKSAFPASLTPLTTYTKIILEYYKDPELRLLLSEDFTQYSLKYACENLKLCVSENSENVIIGVDESKKCVKLDIVGNLQYNRNDISMVYIRNCENKNWIKTNPPTVDHIKKIGRNDSDKENDHGYDSSANISSDSEMFVQQNVLHIENEDDDQNLESKIEGDEQDNIFDDDFRDLVEYEEKEGNTEIKTESPDIEDTNVEPIMQNNDILDSKIEDYADELSNHSTEYFFNPDTFDREKAIRELVLKTCNKYQISVPMEYKTKPPTRRKRKSEYVSEEAEHSKPKKKRIHRSEVKAKVNNLLSVYYDHLRNDAFNTLSDQVQSFLHGLSIDNDQLNMAEESVQGLDRYDGEFNMTEENDFTNVDEIVGDNTENETQRDTEDPSVVEIANETIESELPDESSQWDPKFDEKKYDVKQLYVRLRSESDNEDDLFDIGDDPEIEKILDKKIEECKKIIESVSETREEIPDKISEDSDWDDNIPLQVLKEEKLTMLNRQKEKKNLKYRKHLIKNRKEINNFNYWTKHYTTMKTANVVDKFTAEVKENFPNSFAFIILECAAMLDCTPYLLYRSMMDVERVLLARC